MLPVPRVEKGNLGAIFSKAVASAVGGVVAQKRWNWQRRGRASASLWAWTKDVKATRRDARAVALP
ncbi:MAG: hypothetical protein ABR985_17035 [Methanotrichaceae archaeon]